MEQEGVTCPECNTVNETGWSFCQQCGKKLPKSAPAADLKPVAAALKTVPEKQPNIDASVLKTVAEKSPASQQPFKTVMEKAPAAEADQNAAPASAPEWPITSGPDSSSLVPTIVVEAAAQPKAAAPGPESAEQRAAPPEVNASEPTTQHVHSVSGVLCTQCGQSNSVGSAFCASCGAPMTFGSTRVMSSLTAAGGGRLHLVMEGGQPGEIYELREDTVIGRSNGDIIFAHDGFMSGRHARIVRRDGKFVLMDENSRNGTFIKIKGEIELQPGDMILIGKQLFRFEV